MRSKEPECFIVDGFNVTVTFEETHYVVQAYRTGNRWGWSRGEFYPYSFYETYGYVLERAKETLIEEVFQIECKRDRLKHNL